MSFVPLVRIWVWLSVLASVAGWVLSALGQLNRAGYAVFALVVGIGVWLGRRKLGWLWAEQVWCWPKARKRFRRWLPAGFAVLAFLVLLGAALYPPTTHQALSCRVPRVLHWLAEGQWHWIHTPAARLNDRPCGLVWMWAPLVAFTKSDRGLFLTNFIPLLLLPGLCYSVLTRLGVRGRVAWHWMWLLPTGYSYLLQGGSLGDDAAPAVYALAAMDFGLRAWASRRPADLWMSVLAAAMLSGAKVTNLPLLLPWAILVVPLLPVLLRRPVVTAGLVVLAATVSFLPTAALNQYHCGDWTALKLEPPVIAIKNPLVGLWGNALLLLKNLAPPFFPAARWWNATALTWLPEGMRGAIERNFEPSFVLLGELPTEDAAGLGFGVSWLLVVSVAAAWWVGRGARAAGGGKQLMPAGLRRAVLVAPWVSLLAYGLKNAMVDLPRHISAYYPLLVAALLLAAGHAVVVRRQWWRGLAWGVLALAVPVVVLVPGRPLWPARTVLTKLHELKPDSRLIERALTVYRVYGMRSDPLANVRALLPQGLKVVGFMGTIDDVDISLWRPLGSRKVKHILLSDSGEAIRQRGIRYAVLGQANLEENKTTLAEWQARTGAELVATAVATVTVTQGPREWYVLRFADR